MEALGTSTGIDARKKSKGIGTRLSNFKQSISGGKAKKSLSARQKHAPYPSISQGYIRTPRVSPDRSSDDLVSRPSLKLKILDTPLEASSSDDELLLTSKGWNFGHE